MASNARQAGIALSPTLALFQTIGLQPHIDDSHFCLPTENRVGVRAMARATEIYRLDGIQLRRIHSEPLGIRQAGRHKGYMRDPGSMARFARDPRNGLVRTKVIVCAGCGEMTAEALTNAVERRVPAGRSINALRHVSGVPGRNIQAVEPAIEAELCLVVLVVVPIDVRLTEIAFPQCPLQLLGGLVNAIAYQENALSVLRHQLVCVRCQAETQVGMTLQRLRLRRSHRGAPHEVAVWDAAFSA